MGTDAELGIYRGMPVDLQVPGYYPDDPECDDPECACHGEKDEGPGERGVTMTEVF